MSKVRVLIVDDSALVRGMLQRGLSKDIRIEVVGAAKDPFEARDMIVKHKPDVLTLDVEMPNMTGVEFLRKLMPQYPLPIVMVSSLTRAGQKTTLDALEAGAVDFIAKPTNATNMTWDDVISTLVDKVIGASKVDVSKWKGKKQQQVGKDFASDANIRDAGNKIIALGASTGGTEAIKSFLADIPMNAPGIVIVQHMPSGFTKMFADRLNSLYPLTIKEAETGDKVIPGTVLIAPGDYHMTVQGTKGNWSVRCSPGELVSGHRPSVDVLFESVASKCGEHAYGVILTGMGKDGAKGMKQMHDAGAWNIGQDEESSVVYGMPKVAHELGGVDLQAPLSTMARKLIDRLK